MRAAIKTWARSMFSAGVLALGACNAVLGIEDAELDQAATGTGGTGAPSGGSGGSSPGGTSHISAKAQTTCDTKNPACTSCVEACHPSAIDSCLASAECRNGVISYLTCLESDCSDTSGDCIEPLQVDDAGRSIALCLASDCIDDCSGGGGLVTVCDTYCSCMPDICASVVGGSTREQCLAACGQLVAASGIAMAVCRLNHCQIANVDLEQHCAHAVGELNNPCQASANAPTNCGRAEKGWPCSQNTQCCTNNCVGGLSCG